jgi:hypothetical protein
LKKFAHPRPPVRGEGRRRTLSDYCGYIDTTAQSKTRYGDLALNIAKKSPSTKAKRDSPWGRKRQRVWQGRRKPLFQRSRDEEQRHELVEAAVTAEKKNEEEEEAFRVETAAAAKLIDERAAEQIKAMRMEIIFVYI